MTQEEKQLLLKDLYARLLYGVIVEVEYYDASLKDTHIFKDIVLTIRNIDKLLVYWVSVKPYLRPMSSMTEEEVKEFAALESIDVLGGDTKITCVELSIDAIDWLNAHHFDYRGLLEKGLALEASEGMYE